MVQAIGEDASEQKVIDNIAAHGWHCIHVMADGDLAAFTYTIGLFHSFAHPELILFGVPARPAQRILAIAADAARAGTPLDLAQPSDALLQGYTCCFAQVPTSEYHEHVGYARWYYEGNDFPLVQVVWPSKSGLFPWDPRAPDEFRSAQPVIGTVPAGS
jgi:hypothetical protein